MHCLCGHYIFVQLWSLKQETVSGSGISWVMCKSAPHSRQITMPASHHSVFLHARCPSCHPTNSVRALYSVTANYAELCILCQWHIFKQIWNVVGVLQSTSDVVCGCCCCCQFGMKLGLVNSSLAHTTVQQLCHLILTATTDVDSIKHHLIQVCNIVRHLYCGNDEICKVLWLFVIENGTIMSYL